MTERKIRCPHCGQEYLLGEIFIPESVVGKPKRILRDPLGHIIYEEYKDEKDKPIDEEQYICDNCEKPFIVEIEINAKTRTVEEELDFSKLYVNLWDN